MLVPVVSGCFRAERLELLFLSLLPFTEPEAALWSERVCVGSSVAEGMLYVNCGELVLAIASKVRIAHGTSHNIFANSNEIDNVYNGFDIVLMYLGYKLRNSTCSKSIYQVYSDFVSSNDIRALGDFSQQRV